VLQLTVQVLERHGYTVIAAEDPRQALAVAAAHRTPIDLLLTDVVMPGMSGRDLAQEVLAIGATERVVFMSGYHQHGPLPEPLLINKPFQRVDLLERVRTVLADPP